MNSKCDMMIWSKDDMINTLNKVYQLTPFDPTSFIHASPGPRLSSNDGAGVLVLVLVLVTG